MLQAQLTSIPLVLSLYRVSDPVNKHFLSLPLAGLCGWMLLLPALLFLPDFWGSPGWQPQLHKALKKQWKATYHPRKPECLLFLASWQEDTCVYYEQQLFWDVFPLSEEIYKWQEAGLNLAFNCKAFNNILTMRYYIPRYDTVLLSVLKSAF